MAGIGDTAALQAQTAGSKADEMELVRYKQRMDSLKQRIASGPSKEKQLRKACRDFEAVFIGKLWEQMRKTVPKDESMHSQQEDMYISMFDRSFSEQMAESGGIGLADMLYDQLASRLKTASNETLPGNVAIKPLAENDKPEIKSLSASRVDTRLHRGPEPETPAEVASPVQSGESVSADEPLGAEGAGASVSSSAADVGALSAVEVDARLARLAREIGTPRRAVSGRILAQYK